jgi:hypothetical protein
MQAKYPGTCNLCGLVIVPGDEITRDNNRKPHSFYVHSGCNPVAGISRAGFVVEVTRGDEKGYIAVGVVKRYVYRGPADGFAEGLRQLGATVEVKPVA